MPACLAKIAGMASSSKRRRASSSKQSSAGTARVISVKRTDALPRKGGASTGQLATAVAGSTKKAQSLQQTKTSARRTKATRATGRASGKLNKPAAMIAPAVEPEIVTALEPVAETVETELELEVEASAIVEETAIVEAPFALPVEQFPVSGETRTPPLAGTAAASPTPAALARHYGKRALVAVASQLLSTLRRWTGVR